MRNPLRARWAVFIAFTNREVSRHWTRGMAMEVIAELEGRRGQRIGQAYAPGALGLRRLP